MNVLKTTWRTAASMLAVLAGLFLVGCGTLEPFDQPMGGNERPMPAGAESPKIGAAVRFQTGDLVRIDFSGTTVPIIPHEEHIKDDGTINLHLIGKIKAAGKTPGELQEAIQQAYVPRYYKHLTVTVRGADLFYYVGGNVKMPGRQPYYGPITVAGAINSAADFDDFANQRKVKLIRSDGTIHTVDVVKARQNPKLDLPVYPGDKIEVPKRFW